MKIFGKKILLAIQQFGLGALFFLVGVAFVAAVVDAVPRGEVALKSIFLAAIDVIASDAKDTKGAAKLMHVLLTVAFGWAAIKVYMATAGHRWDAFSARYLSRNHIVIIAGRSVNSSAEFLSARKHEAAEKLVDQTQLAIDIALELSLDHDVVLHIPDLHSSRLEKLWSVGVSVLNEDMEFPELLQATSIGEAKMLIAMRDVYSENIVAIQAALSQSGQNPALECRCMIEPLSVKQGFKLEDYLDDEMLARVRVFNHSELIARRIVQSFPPDAPVAQTNDGVHLLLVGFGSVGQSIAVQLARMGHYRSGKKPKITIIDKQIENRWQKTIKMYETLPEWLDVEPVETRIEDVKELHVEKWLQDDRPITMVYVCTKDELANLRIARLLLKVLNRKTDRYASNIQLVVLDPPGGCILGDFSKREDSKNRFKLFSIVKAEAHSVGSAVAANLLTETDDSRAKQLHLDYCKNQDEELEKNPTQPRKPAHKLWEYLAETYRDASRSSADHIDIKLRAVGRVLSVRDDAIELPLTENEIELLAEMEHQRWWAERSIDGWRYAPIRNDALKLHPNMVPYKNLDEEIKKLDRNSVIKMMEIVSGQEKILTKNTCLT
jgi:hypothetical protein